VVEDDDPFGAALAPDQRLAFRVVDPPYLGIVVEIGDPGRGTDKAEALALELEAVGAEPAVVDHHRVGFAIAADALVAPSRRGDIGDELVGISGEIAERRLERFRGAIELGDFNHWAAPSHHNP